MRIANVMVAGGKGGLERAAVDYADALQRCGHDVVTVFRSGAWALGLAREKGLATETLSVPQRWNPIARLRLRRILESSEVAFVHGNRAGSLLSRLGRRKRIVAVAHSASFRADDAFTAIFATTQEAAEALRATRPDRPVYYVPNMVEMPELPARGPFRAPPVVAAMGRLAPEKGFDTLIDAIAMLREEGVALRAVIAGSGRLDGALRTQVAARGLERLVDFPGWIDDKGAFFREADIFCLPSRQEPFGIALLEAMAHGCPSVATACIGPRSLIEDGATGRLIEPSTGALANALRRMLEAPDAARAMGERARAKVEGAYSVAAVAKLMDAALKEIAPQAVQA